MNRTYKTIARTLAAVCAASAVCAAAPRMDRSKLLIGDEPSAFDFAYFGEVVRQLSRERPGLPLYLNLYPN